MNKGCALWSVVYIAAAVVSVSIGFGLAQINLWTRINGSFCARYHLGTTNESVFTLAGSRPDITSGPFFVLIFGFNKKPRKEASVLYC